MSERRLVARGLGLSSGGHHILADVDLDALPGRMLAVTGASGAGKTSLLSVLGGLLAPTSGTVTYAGEPVATRSGEPRRGTALVLQGHALVPSLTSEENVTIGLRAGGEPPGAAARAAVHALQRVGVDDLADRLVTELSGGQLQRVAVARALSSAPEVLLADEPTSELDEQNRDRVVAELRAEADRGAVVVLATHDPEVAAACDDQLHLTDGRAAREPVTVSTAEVPGHEHDAFRRPGSAGTR
jgi:putative ABC transport system ATP-binding protein